MAFDVDKEVTAAIEVALRHVFARGKGESDCVINSSDDTATEGLLEAEPKRRSKTNLQSSHEFAGKHARFSVKASISHIELSTAMASHVLSDEKEALLTFKAGISQDPFNILGSWSSSSSSSPYINGSHARNAERRVLSLDLHASSLTGYIPPNSLSNLTLLTRLNLSSNNLTGALPGPQLGLLASLTHLDFSGNSLTGFISAVLDLSNSYLDGNIPAELGQLEDLERLSLSLNFAIFGVIPPELGQLNNLQFLILDRTNLSGSMP